MSGALDFSEKRTILVVDDTPENLAVMSGVLRLHYTVKAAPSGERALQIAFGPERPDLILLDIMMPEMDGYEVLRRLHADPRTEGIPVIFVTAKDQEADEEEGLDLGAVDYITKPISPAILLARVRNHLLLKEARDFLKEEKNFLKGQLGGAQMAAIQAFVSLAEVRDDETPNHLLRMQHYVRVLAERLSDHPRFSSFLTDETVTLLSESVALHNIGKVGIPDRVLSNAHPEGDDLRIMKTHPTIGRDVIARVQQRVGGDASFLAVARDIVHAQREKWDGSGYPQGLRGDDIPIPARLVALAAVYDSLTGRHANTTPAPHAEAAEIIVQAKGSHFDPDVVEAFMDTQREFESVSQRLADSEADVEAHLARWR